MERFGGRVAIVTGAGSGIGRATTVRLAGEGATVIAVDRDDEGLAATAAAAGRPVSTVLGDVTDPGCAREAVAAATDRHGRLDTLVNNAGILRFDHSHEVEPAAWDEILSVNLTSVFRFCQAVIPLMLAAGQGAIVNVASTAALFGHPWAAAYGRPRAAS